MKYDWNCGNCYHHRRNNNKGLCHADPFEVVECGQYMPLRSRDGRPIRLRADDPPIGEQAILRMLSDGALSEGAIPVHMRSFLHSAVRHGYVGQRADGKFYQIWGCS